jgi:hypothetical protein
MAKFRKGDCRNKSKRKSALGTMKYIDGPGYTPADGPNRHERRTEHHFRGIRMNTVGFPIGFNCETWRSRCVTIAEEQRISDASKGKKYTAPDKTRRSARPQDLVFKGFSNTKILRKMARRYGVREVARAMAGLDRGQRNFPAYPLKGARTREGFLLTVPKGRK